MDMTESITPKSDQINAEDLLAGPETFTIERVEKGSTEQPVNIHMAERPGRPYRPSKSMRRVLVNAWGKDSSVYAGRRLTLYRDPDVKFGGDAVGGIKISHLSHIAKRTSVSLTVTRGKRAPHTVDPLSIATPMALPEPTADQVAECADEAELTSMWRRSGPERQVQIQERVAELRAAPEATS